MGGAREEMQGVTCHSGADCEQSKKILTDNVS